MGWELIRWFYCHIAGPYKQTAEFTRVSGQSQRGEETIQQKCVKCHGSDGTGNTTYGQIIGATNLTDPEWQERVDDKRLVNSIKHGRGQMPAFGEKLSEEQITFLTSYVRTLKK